MDNALVREFPPRTLDKVERLLDLLAELDEHPMLRGKWALHVGTAINLFMLEVPRLSMDIDLSYVVALDRDAMLAERPAIESLSTRWRAPKDMPSPGLQVAMPAEPSSSSTGRSGGPTT